jgi:hypothetical protein
MSDKLDAYLEEISHFLSGRAEREEILAEIRSHILEKAAEGPGEFTDAGIERAIAAYGPARRVAERYLEDKPIIAPAYRRYLVRYASVLFAVHTMLTVVAVAFKKDFVLFPFVYMPRLGVIEALMYLPTAFLADLGIVALVLYFITQSGKEVRLPWPTFGVDLDEVRPPAGARFWAARIATAVAAVVMLGITDFALYVFARRQTIFFVNLDWSAAQPLFTPGAGRRISLIVIAMLAFSALSLLAKLFTRSRWVDIVSNAISLALFGLLLGQPFEGLFAIPLPERLLSWLKPTLTFTLLFTALMIALDLIKNVVVISRRRFATSGR